MSCKRFVELVVLVSKAKLPFLNDTNSRCLEHWTAGEDSINENIYHVRCNGTCDYSRDHIADDSSIR